MHEQKYLSCWKHHSKIFHSRVFPSRKVFSCEFKWFLFSLLFNNFFRVFLIMMMNISIFYGCFAFIFPLIAWNENHQNGAKMKQKIISPKWRIIVEFNFTLKANQEREKKKQILKKYLRNFQWIYIRFPLSRWIYKMNSICFLLRFMILFFPPIDL